jgi:hypothetical protein
VEMVRFWQQRCTAQNKHAQNFQDFYETGKHMQTFFFITLVSFCFTLKKMQNLFQADQTNHWHFWVWSRPQLKFCLTFHGFTTHKEFVSVYIYIYKNINRAFFLGGRRGTRTPKHFVNLMEESKKI